jgi:hypothetical protein
MRLGLNFGLRMRLGLNFGLRMTLGLNFGLRMRLELNTGLRMRLGLNLELRMKLGLNLGLRMRLGLNTGLRMRLRLKLGLELRLYLKFMWLNMEILSNPNFLCRVKLKIYNKILHTRYRIYMYLRSPRKHAKYCKWAVFSQDNRSFSIGYYLIISFAL